MGKNGLSVLRLMFLTQQMRCKFVHFLPQLAVIRLQQRILHVEAQISECGAEIGVVIFSIEEEVAAAGRGVDVGVAFLGRRMVVDAGRNAAVVEDLQSEEEGHAKVVVREVVEAEEVDGALPWEVA